MPKPPNSIETVHITLSTTAPVQEHLERLVLTGFYGKNPAEAAERLLAEAIKNLAENRSLVDGAKPAARRFGKGKAT